MFAVGGGDDIEILLEADTEVEAVEEKPAKGKAASTARSAKVSLSLSPLYLSTTCFHVCKVVVEHPCLTRFFVVAGSCEEEGQSGACQGGGRGGPEAAAGACP